MTGALKQRLIDGALAASVVSSAMVLIAHWLGGFDDRADVVGQFAGPAFTMVCFAALAATLLRRPRPACAAALVAAGLFSALFGQWFPTRPAPAGTEASSVRVYLANVGRQTRDFRPLAASVRAADPDVVVLVEVNDAGRRVAPALLPEYPHVVDAATAWDRKGGHGQKLVLSRTPLRKALEIKPWRATPEQHADIVRRVLSTGYVGTLDVETTTAGGSMRLLVGGASRPWPFYPRGRHAAQVDSLVETVARGDARRTVLLGDFNATPAGENLRRLSRRTALSPAPAVLGTWPAALPGVLGISLDNVFVGEAWRVERRRLGRATGSDHRPVVVDLVPAGTTDR